MIQLKDLTFDFETYFDTDYSMRKIGTVQYVRDERFHAHGVAVKEGQEESYWVPHDELESWANSVPWHLVRAIAHNYYFDGLVLWEHYGKQPAMRTCTLSLARSLLGDHKLNFDLDSVCKLLGIPGKISGLDDTKGKMDLTAEEMKNLITYALNDSDKCHAIDEILWPLLPDGERELLDLTLRMGTVPKLNIDPVRAKQELVLATKQQKEAVDASGIAKSRLSSNPQFAELIKSLGLEPPTKLNKKGKETWAFSKDDLDFKNLMADNPEHELIWKGRLAAKSNIRQSRAQRFLVIHSTKAQSRDGSLPVPLKYSGAHTHRWSGTDKINLQNLPRIYKKDPLTGLLRKSIIAPDGYVILVCDSSNVELRFNMWLAGQEDVLTLLRNGGDSYCYTASEHFGYEVVKGMDERQFGKMLDLALGFGMGWRKFKTNAAMGFMGCPAVYMSDQEAFSTVNQYRTNKWAIKAFWDFLQGQIPLMTSKTHKREYKCLEFGYEQVTTPGGLTLAYPDLRVDEENNWAYGLKYDHRIYGGLFDENVTQNVARTAVGEQILRIDKHYDGIHTVGMCHDEGLWLVKESEAEDAQKIVIEEMSKSPVWAPDIPLAAEAGYSVEYSK